MNTYPVTYGSNVNNNNTTKFSIIFFTDTIIINCAYVYTLIWVKRCPIFVESIQFLSQWHCHIDNQVHCHYYYKISWSGTVLYYWYCNRVLEYSILRYYRILISISIQTSVIINSTITVCISLRPSRLQVVESWCSGKEQWAIGLQPKGIVGRRRVPGINFSLSEQIRAAELKVWRLRLEHRTVAQSTPLNTDTNNHWQ